MANESNIPEVIFFIIIGLFIGALMRELKKSRFKIPYSPVILALGILAGSLRNAISSIGYSEDFITEINPEGILLIFLPILIFESSFNSDWYIFKKCFYQVILLSIPGVIICCVFIAGTLKLILRYDDEELPWSCALTFGAIASATDPIAVVSLLKELQANHYFSTIVEGESLLNDGTSMVFFSIFLEMSLGHSATFGDGIKEFITLVFGGVGVGLGVGIITAFWLEKIMKDSVLAITLIFSANYLVLYLASNLNFEFSGILGLCTLGLYMAANGKIKISHRIENSLHAVISWTQYAAETLIFLMTGIIIGAKIIADPSSKIEGSDWLRMVAFFVINNFIRGLMMFMLYPFLKKGHYKPTWREYVVMSYSGLRGALGLVLGLIVHINPFFMEPQNRRASELILFYIAGLSALSVLINGTTAGLVVKGIKMIKKNEAQQRIFTALLREMNTLSMNEYETLRENTIEHPCDWEQVKNLTEADDEFLPMLVEMGSTTEVISEARHRFLQKLISMTWERFETNELNSEGANLLVKAMKVNSDNLEKPLKIYEFLYLYFIHPFPVGIYEKLIDFPLIGKHFKKMIVNYIILIFEVNMSLISMVDHLKDFANELPIPTDVTKLILAELVKNQRQSSNYLEQLEKQFPVFIKYINTRRSSILILHKQKKFIRESLASGKIEISEAEILIEKVNRRLMKMKDMIKEDTLPQNLSRLTLKFPTFNLLNMRQMDILESRTKILKYPAGREIYKENEEVDSMLLILKGEVIIKVKDEYIKKGVGKVISYTHLVTDDYKSRISCKAKTDLKVQLFDPPTLKTFMRQNLEFESKVYKAAFKYLRYVNPESFDCFTSIKKRNLKEINFNSEIVKFFKTEKLNLSYGGFIFTGTLSNMDKVYEELTAIPPSDDLYEVTSSGVLLKFINPAQSPLKASPKNSPISKPDHITLLESPLSQK